MLVVESPVSGGGVVVAEAGNSGGGVPSTIDPTRIPLFEGDLAVVEAAAAKFRKAGTRCTTAGAGVDSRFQSLASCYRAPGRWELLASTARVRTGAVSFGGDLKAVGDALADYAAEMRPVAAALSRLFDQALAFTVSVSGDGTWDRDKAKVDANNALIRQVSAQAETKAAVERRCANRIEALVGGRVWHASDRPGDPQFAYGAADIPDDAATPWGTPAGWDPPWNRGVVGVAYRYLIGVTHDGLGGTLHGIGVLSGVYGSYARLGARLGLVDQATANAHSAATVHAWRDLALAALAVHPVARPVLHRIAPRLERDADATLTRMVKGMVAFDTWRTDPARAAGATVFNLGTMLLPGGEATGALKALKGLRTGSAEAGILDRLVHHADEAPHPHLPDSVPDRSVDVHLPGSGETSQPLRHLDDPVGDRLQESPPPDVAAGHHGQDLADVSGKDVPPPLTAADGPAMPTKEMEQVFVEMDRAEGVTYLTASELEEARVVVRDGKLYDSTGAPFDTGRGTSVWAGGDTRAIFVMDRYGNIYASNDHAVGRFHHSSFLGGKPVAGAGELKVEDGVLKLISDKSGHYRPPPECMRRVVAALKAAGVDVDGVEFDTWGS